MHPMLETTTEEIQWESGAVVSDWSANYPSDWPDADPSSPPWDLTNDEPVKRKPVEQPSPATLRWEQNFKRGRCPHGVRFYSPSDSCLSCDLEVTLSIKQDSDSGSKETPKGQENPATKRRRTHGRKKLHSIM